MCSGSEAGSYLRLIHFVYHSSLGLRVIKKKKEGEAHLHFRLFRVEGSGFRVLGCRVPGLGCRVQGLGFRVQDLGFRV